ncbi:MAG: PAS domain S-box protein [Desulfobacteraceae bacterium]|nr:PAS domain S-box protein [Desulfobacteraceae bacterium]MBC2755513.1 PAS domain S-box protein [Desulfobacteraceae bacterium]
MKRKATYDELERQIEVLSRESQRCLTAEAAFHCQNTYLKALHETALGLIDKLDKEELLENILDRAALLTGTEHGYIYLREPGSEQMQMQMGMGFFKSQLGRKVSIGEGLGGRVWEKQAPLLVDDYQCWPKRIPDKSLDKLRSIVGIPLKSDQQVLGVIGLAHVDTDRQLNQEDVMALELFATLAMIALEKARLYADARRELAERKHAEEVLRESEARYRTLLESSPDPIVVYDMKGVATYVNPAFEQTFGLTRKKLLGKQIDFVPNENWPETKAAIKKMLSGQKINLFETRRMTKDGRVLDVQLSSTLYKTADGRPAGNIVILRDISAKKQAKKELQMYHDHLEELVAARTVELEKANLALEQQIEERKLADRSLREHQKELRAQSHHLEEVNTALRVLLKQREEDKHKLSKMVRRNVEELVNPYLEKVFNSNLDTRQRMLLQILETNLKNIISPFINQLTGHMGNLTPMEIRIADLIKAGKSNKEIAGLLLISYNTVLFHRHNIRSKLNIKNKKINLRAHLLSFEK